MLAPKEPPHPNPLPKGGEGVTPSSHWTHWLNLSIALDCVAINAIIELRLADFLNQSDSAPLPGLHSPSHQGASVMYHLSLPSIAVIAFLSLISAAAAQPAPPDNRPDVTLRS